MLRLLRSLTKNRKLLGDFVMRDLRARYVGSSMGFFWSVVFPIINLFLYVFVFRVVLNMRWDDAQSPSEVALIMLTGIVVWTAFAESMTRTTNSLVENANLIQKVVFPSEILPVFMVWSSIVNMLIAMPIVLAAVVLVPIVDPITDPAILALREHRPELEMGLGSALLAVPLLVVLQMLFTTGLGLFFSAFNLFWRDIYHLMGVAIVAWMFATPIFYPEYLVEKAGYIWLVHINPMAWLIEGYREAILFNRWPDPRLLAQFAGVSALLVALGATFFFRQRRRFPDLL